MKNIYSIWQALDGLSGRFFVESVEDKEEGLTIILRQAKEISTRRLKIVFDPFIAYRNMDESYRSRTFSEKGGFKNSLNLVAKSSWLEWLQAESQGYYEFKDLIHYAIITDADFIDVLSEFPPTVNWVDCS